MKTRFLSLFLAAVLLLGMIPGAALAADEVASFKASLTLTDSFAINFKIAEASVADFGKVVFTSGETVLSTVEALPEAQNGMYVFSYADIAPHKMGENVTATMYNTADTMIAQSTCSVATYCNAILANAETYGEELSMLAMEVLDYGAAAQKYVAELNETTVTDADLVNNGIATNYTDIWTLSGSLVFDYRSVRNVGTEIADPSVDWTGVGLYLEDRISIRYKFTAESVEGLTMLAQCGEYSWTVSNFYPTDDGAWYAYFDGLNPAQMRDTVVVTMYKGGEAVSNSLTYSVESYVDDAFSAGNKTLKTLLQDMLYYGDAAAKYVKSQVVLWDELASMPVDETTVLGTNFAKLADNTSIATDKGCNDSYSIMTDSNGRVQFKNTLSHTAGTWYRFSGYVYLGNVSASSLGFTVYQRKADNSGYNLPTFSTASEVDVLHVEEADENGWSYFYFDIQHLYANTLLQINSAKTGGTVYYDDIKYEKYLGEGQPPVLETEEETPEWEVLYGTDFEDENHGIELRDKAATAAENWGVEEDATRTGSAKVLRVGAKNRVYHNDASAKLPKGYYKFSGYVKIGNNDAEKTAIQIQAYKNYVNSTANGNTSDSDDNLLSPTFKACFVGKADAEGWQYFEVIFDHGADYTLIRVSLGDKINTTADLYFDNIQYAKYLGSTLTNGDLTDD